MPLRCDILTVLLWLGAGLALLGCYCNSDDHQPGFEPDAVRKISYSRRDLPSGHFKDYLIGDAADARKVWGAIETELQAGADGQDAEISLSANHKLTILGENGQVLGRYSLLGDKYLYVDGKRYPCQTILAAISELERAGRLIPTDP